jgi:hypothetical protein
MDLEAYRNEFADSYHTYGYDSQLTPFKIRKVPQNPDYQSYYADELEEKIQDMIANPEMPGIAYARGGQEKVIFAVIIENIREEAHRDMANRARDVIFTSMIEPLSIRDRFTQLPKLPSVKPRIKRRRTDRK